VLTGGDVDAIAGLLVMRERHAFTIYATRSVHDLLAANPIFEVLARDLVERLVVAPDERVVAGDLLFEIFPVPGKPPLYMEGPDVPVITTSGNTVGLHVTSGASHLFFIPGCATMTPDLASRLRGAEVVFFDGTLWRDDEMIRLGLGTKTGRRMGHMSVSGPNGVLSAFAHLDVKRRILIHINNSNPVLLEDSPERAEVQAAGWEVAFDGMEVVL